MFGMIGWAYSAAGLFISHGLPFRVLALDADPRHHQQGPGGCEKIVWVLVYLPAVPRLLIYFFVGHPKGGYR